MIIDTPAHTVTVTADEIFDWFDQLEDIALARLRDADAMSVEETDDEEEDSNCAIQTIGRLTSLGSPPDNI